MTKETLFKNELFWLYFILVFEVFCFVIQKNRKRKKVNLTTIKVVSNMLVFFKAVWYEVLLYCIQIFINYYTCF